MTSFYWLVFRGWTQEILLLLYFEEKYIFGILFKRWSIKIVINRWKNCLVARQKERFSLVWLVSIKIIESKKMKIYILVSDWSSLLKILFSSLLEIFKPRRKSSCLKQNASIILLKFFFFGIWVIFSISQDILSISSKKKKIF